MALLFSRDHHTLGDTLIILDGTAKVNTPHTLHQDVYLCTFPHGRQQQRTLVLDTVYLAYVFPVNKHLGVVVHLSGQQALHRDFGQCSGVQHHTPAHVNLLKGHDAVFALSGTAHRQVLELRQFELRNTYMQTVFIPSALHIWIRCSQ